MNGFCEFAGQLSGIVQILLPQSPEYTVTYGLLSLLFKAVVDKQKQQERLAVHVETLRFKLPLVDFYQKVFPTNQMKMVVAQLYTNVLLFLQEALAYYRSGRLDRILDSIMQSGEDRFADVISQVTSDADKLKALADVAHVAQQADMKELLLDTNKVVVQMYNDMENFALAVGSSLMFIDRRCMAVEIDTTMMVEAQASQYVHQLADHILPDGIDPQIEAGSFANSGNGLSARDHWDDNGVLEDLYLWSKNYQNLLFWVGGTSGNQNTWVTEFAYDFISALQTQQVNLLFAFCDLSEMVTPTLIVRKLIYQILMSQSKLVFKHSSALNIRRCRQAKTFEALWDIFGLLLTKLSPDPVIIVLDRIEKCGPSQELESLLLRGIVDLVRSNPNVHIIVTSIYEPPPRIKAEIHYTYIDTGKPVRKRGR